MWGWLVDRLIFCPSRRAIDCESQRRWIAWDGGQFEAWVQHTGDRPPQLFVLKFPGTGGRAERSTSHPADCWDDLAVDVWTVNPPGYGGSPGRASLTSMRAVAEAAWRAISDEAAGRPVLVAGNSLGSLSALYLAAQAPVAGLLLRNPVPLREVIVSRFSRLATPIARQVPIELCPIGNAAPRAAAPAVFVCSGKDRVVPPPLQERIFSQYAGPSRVLRLPDADHADSLDEQQRAEYLRLLHWLRSQIPDLGSG